MTATKENPMFDDKDPPDRFRDVVFAGYRPRKTEARRSSESSPSSASSDAAAAVVEEFERPSREALFARMVLRSVGLNPAHYRVAPLVRRIPACLRMLRMPDLDAAERLLAEESERRFQALNALLIGSTGFFRDEQVFRSLRDEVIPEILGTRSRPRIWSVACSEGAELYSVAMLVAERGRAGYFLGTDCREEAITAARAGRYPLAALEAVPEEFRGRYLSQVGGMAAVEPRLKAAARWQIADAFSSGRFAEWDMILCRNLAIYLDAASVENLWRTLTAALLPGGFLVVGKAEKIRLPELQRVAPCIYRKSASRFLS